MLFLCHLGLLYQDQCVVMGKGLGTTSQSLRARLSSGAEALAEFFISRNKNLCGSRVMIFLAPDIETS